MKTIWALLGILFISILIMDIGTVYVTYDKIAGVTEQSLDSAIIAGVRPSDARIGETFVDKASAVNAATTVFRNNLKLNAALENSIMKNTSFIVSIINNADKPYVQGEVSTVVTALSPKLFGLNGIPIRVRKNQFQVSSYK
jgi:hypothetical protein